MDREAVAKELAKELGVKVVAKKWYAPTPWEGVDGWLLIPSVAVNALISLRCERDAYRKRYGAFTGTEISDIEKAGLSLELVEILEDRCSNLERQRDTALAERDIAREACKNFHGASHDLARAKLAAEAERDELRKAVEGEIKWLTGVGGMTFVGVASPRDRIDTLRLALHDKEKG